MGFTILSWVFCSLPFILSCPSPTPVNPLLFPVSFIFRSFFSYFVTHLCTWTWVYYTYVCIYVICVLCMCVCHGMLVPWEGILWTSLLSYTETQLSYPESKLRWSGLAARTFAQPTHCLTLYYRSGIDSGEYIFMNVVCVCMDMQYTCHSTYVQVRGPSQVLVFAIHRSEASLFVVWSWAEHCCWTVSTCQLL